MEFGAVLDFRAARGERRGELRRCPFGWRGGGDKVAWVAHQDDQRG